MALTEKKIKDLEDKDFHTLYDDHKERWTKLAKTAQKHARDNITDGNEPRPDDVSKALYPMLEVNKVLRAHQETNKARGKRYIDWFVEYVIDKSL
jgi:hypothetical protein